MIAAVRRLDRGDTYAIQGLDMEAPGYALTVLTLVEAILENPDVILDRQLDRLPRVNLSPV
jgi:hypothetical protein